MEKVKEFQEKMGQQIENMQPHIAKAKEQMEPMFASIGKHAAEAGKQIETALEPLVSSLAAQNPMLAKFLPTKDAAGAAPDEPSAPEEAAVEEPAAAPEEPAAEPEEPKAE